MPIGIGHYNPLGMQLGGGESTLESEHRALLQELEKALDPTLDTAQYWEVYSEAVATYIAWRVVERISNQMIPTRMMENLPKWEEATALVVDSTDLETVRRRNLAAKMRGLGGAYPEDAAEIAATSAGANFIEMLRVSSSLEITVYWPGVSPGPPGLEWSSNRASIGVKMSADGLTNEDFDLRRAALFKALDDALPAWMSIVIGVGDGFVVGAGIVGRTFL